MTDNERFELRILNSRSYAAYYNQTVKCDAFDGRDFRQALSARMKTNPNRMIRLAQRGRQFPNVQQLVFVLTGFLARADVQAITPEAFPSLKTLAFFDQDALLEPRYIKSLPPIPTLDTLVVATRELSSITEKAYPSLRKLVIRDNVEGFLNLTAH